MFEVLGNVFQLLVTDAGFAFTVVAENTFATLEECWAAAEAFNAEAKGTGYLMACWPMPVEGV